MKKIFCVLIFVLFLFGCSFECDVKLEEQEEEYKNQIEDLQRDFDIVSEAYQECKKGIK